MTGAPRPIATPCVKVCELDPVTGLCLGCRRTGDEIAAWTRLSDAERAAIMREAPQRRLSAPYDSIPAILR